LFEPEDDSCSDADGGHEGVGAAVVACVDAPPAFETSEHILDHMALAIERLVIRNMDFAIGQRSTQSVSVIISITEQGLGFGERIDHER